jgi:predicted CopG family antitoxin
MPNIRIDEEVYQHLNEQGKTEDTFNDVLRRLLGFDSLKKNLDRLPSTKSLISETAGENRMIEPLMEKWLPNSYLDNPVHRRQLVNHVRYFLLSPKDWSTKDRQISAAKKVSEEEGVKLETILDGGTRRLRINSEQHLNIENFRGRLESIETDYIEGKEK